MENGNKKSRIVLLDLLRGAAMIYVVLYHVMYDIGFIYGRETPALITPGNSVFEVIHTFFLWILFAVSGICSGFSRNSLKRGAFLYIVGFLITLFTSVFMPSELIVFGVLSCFGACMVMTSLVRPFLDKIPPYVLLALSVMGWLMFREFYRSGEIWLLFTSVTIPSPANAAYLYPIGIKAESFKSADYFPIIPYIFMFWAGSALYRPLTENKLPERLYDLKPGVIGFIGRHSLIIYAVHQPLLILIFEIIFGG